MLLRSSAAHQPSSSRAITLTPDQLSSTNRSGTPVSVINSTSSRQQQALQLLQATSGSGSGALISSVSIFIILALNRNCTYTQTLGFPYNSYCTRLIPYAHHSVAVDFNGLHMNKSTRTTPTLSQLMAEGQRLNRRAATTQAPAPASESDEALSDDEQAYGQARRQKKF